VGVIPLPYPKSPVPASASTQDFDPEKTASGVAFRRHPVMKDNPIFDQPPLFPGEPHDFIVSVRV
jgi:hypothetical protein